jgi:hypothetical protein
MRTRTLNGERQTGNGCILYPGSWIVYHSFVLLNLDSEIGVWMQGAAPSALIFMLTIFPGLTAGATLCRRFAPSDVICSIWGEIRTYGSSDVEPQRGDRK